MTPSIHSPAILPTITAEQWACVIARIKGDPNPWNWLEAGHKLKADPEKQEKLWRNPLGKAHIRAVLEPPLDLLEGL